MLEPQKVISESTSNGVSVCFCAQWYPNVCALLIPEVSDAGSILVELLGSMVPDVTKAAIVATATYTATQGTTPQKMLKPVGEWYLYYWIRLTCTTADAVITEAYIGAGGS